MEKIIFYIYSLNKGGAERVLVTLMEELKNKYEIILLTDTVDENEYTLPDGILRIVIGETTGKFSFLKRIGKIRSIIKENGANKVVAFMVQTGIRTVLATRLMRMKVIVAVRSNPLTAFTNKVRKQFINMIFEQADIVVCQTDFQKECFSKKVQKKVRTIANPIALPNVVRENTQRKIVSVGRLFDYKNHLMLIKAFQRISDELQDYKVVIYGEGPYRGELEKYIINNGLEDKVFLPGDVEDVQDNIRDAKLFVLSSDTEGMPNALMEAMALGLPVISTDCPCGGPRTLIQDGVNGMLCEVGNVEQLALKIKEVLQNDTLAVKLGKRAEEIVKECNIKVIAQKWMEVIGCLI